jgi:GldM C-terminal domain
MRKLLLYLLSAFSIKASAQVDIINVSIADSTKPILYIGVDNYVSLKGKNNYVDYSISIAGTNSTITKTGPNKYIARVAEKGTAIITYTEKGKSPVKKNFLVEIVPDPIATLAGLYDTTINRNRILINPQLQVILPNCYYQHSYRVISFQAVFINGSDSIFTFSNYNRLTEEQLKLVRQQTSGATIYFDNIRALSTDSRTVTLQPFWIKIE